MSTDFLVVWALCCLFWGLFCGYVIDNAILGILLAGFGGFFMGDFVRYVLGVF